MSVLNFKKPTRVSARMAWNNEGKSRNVEIAGQRAQLEKE